MSDTDAAVVHETAFEKGGGVRVAEELCRALDAPLYLGFVDEDVVDRIADDVDTRRLFADSRLRRFRHRAKVRHLYYLWAFQHRPELHDFDVVVQSGSGTDWYVPADGQTLVRYVHSPAAHYHVAHAHEDSAFARAFGIASRTLRTPAVRYPSAWVANSEITKRRVGQYFDVDPAVAYPPVDVDAHEPRTREDFYLSLSRLTSRKRVDEVVEAFTCDHPDKRLIVAGGGPREDALREKAGDNVDVRGWVSEEEKRRLLGTCQALVLNSGNESFGIVPAEAFASGAPVVGAADGYTRFQIHDGWNGILYEPGELSTAIDRFDREGVNASTDEITEFAERFGTDAFRDAIRRVVSDAVESDTETPEWNI